MTTTHEKWLQAERDRLDKEPGRREYLVAYRLKNKDRLRVSSNRWQKRQNVNYPFRTTWLRARANATRREIVFLLTLEEWTSFWGDNLELRGKGPDDLCMGRYGDEGPYRIGNIYVTSNSENREGPRPLPEPDF